jgi:hypothetical protein
MAAKPKDPNPDKGWYYKLGPYPDEATARRALEIARERTRKADAEDAEWGGE